MKPARKPKRKALAPRDWRNYGDTLAAPRDNMDWRGFWILSDGFTVSIHAQKNGEPSTQEISIPRKTFDRFVDWYTGRPRKKAVKR